ncbi:hypothetical protein T484DRAFT_1813594 [Baffinella frigidus]|nr:hypothetical protein T484DRAFT_1813594 [Cryptophyta sp. CCMP2293]
MTFAQLRQGDMSERNFVRGTCLKCTAVHPSLTLLANCGAVLDSLMTYISEGPETGPVAMCLEGLTGKVVDAFLESVDSAEATSERDAILERQICGLFHDLLSSSAVRRGAAERWIRAILRRFPALYWSAACLREALGVYEGAVSRAKAQVESCVRDAGVVLSGNFEAFTSEFPVRDPIENARNRRSWMLGGGGAEGGVDPAARHAALKVVESLTRNWLELAFSQAPLLTASLLQVYLSSGSGACSHAVNLLHEAIGGGGGGGREEGSGVAGGRLRLQWKHWGCWAVHGGVDLDVFLQGQALQGRYQGRATACLELAREASEDTSQSTEEAGEQAGLDALRKAASAGSGRASIENSVD